MTLESKITLSGKSAFVSGASGFIGGRIAEVLLRQFGMQVRTLIRNSTGAGSGAFRAAAAGAEIHFGSILDPETVKKAVDGCQIVIHCAYGTSGTLAEQRQVTVDGTKIVAQAASRAGVQQFVHLSTIAAFGGNTPPVVGEDYVNPRIWPWPYARDKLDAEAELAAVAGASGLPFTVLRLGAVYGPYGAAFTVSPLGILANYRMALVNGGSGNSSATYVDDVVQAVVKAGAIPGQGQRFTIRGPDRVTWKEFYGHYTRMLGYDALVSMTPQEMHAMRRSAWRKTLRQFLPEAVNALKASPRFRQVAGGLPFVRSAYSKFGKRILPPRHPVQSKPTQENGQSTREIWLTPELMVEYFANTSEFSIEKARNVLGYRPAFSVDRGMTLTQHWAKWAGLLPD